MLSGILDLKENRMPDNPAYRLHWLLEKLLAYKALPLSGDTTRQAIGHALLSRGPQILDGDYDEDSALYDVFELQQLIHEILAWIKVRDFDHELFKRPVERLWAGIMGIDPGSPWESTKKKLDPADVRSLLYLSHEFDKESKRNAQLLDQEEMTDLVTEVDALYEAVQASDMPEDVKTFILEQLAVIKHAIRVYPYEGYDSLRQALQQNIGAMLLFKERLDEVSDDYAEVGRLKVVMRHLSNVVSKAADVISIAQPVITYLLGGGQPPK